MWPHPRIGHRPERAGSTAGVPPQAGRPGARPPQPARRGVPSRASDPRRACGGTDRRWTGTPLLFDFRLMPSHGTNESLWLQRKLTSGDDSQRRMKLLGKTDQTIQGETLRLAPGGVADP